MKKRLIVILLILFLVTGCFDKENTKKTNKTTKAEDVLVITAKSNRAVSEHTTKNKPTKTTIETQTINTYTTTTRTSTTSKEEFQSINTTTTVTTKATTKKTTTKSPTKSTTTTKKTTKKTTSKSTTKTTTKSSFTESTVKKAILAMKSKYPTGTSWDNSREYWWKASNRTNYVGYGCVAFAYELSDAAFGTAPARIINNRTEVKNYKIKVGDIIRVNNDTHMVIVTNVTSSTLSVAQGNVLYNGKAIVYWEGTISNTDRSGWTFIWTRY